MYEIVNNVNDWIKNYRGQTYNEKLASEITGAVFNEHSKYKNTIPLHKYINKCDFLTENQKLKLINGITDTQIDIFQQLGKKCVVYCMDPKTMEIQDIGISSLLRDTKTGRIEDNLILDNWGLYFAGNFIGSGGISQVSVKDDANTSQTFIIANDSGYSDMGGLYVSYIKMGSGTTAPLRNDHKIETSLANSPESGYIATNTGGYTVSNTIIYQADANPTGGSGTVNEAGTFMHTKFDNVNVQQMMITHDAIGPIAYSTGKLLRAAYAWQI